VPKNSKLKRSDSFAARELRQEWRGRAPQPLSKLECLTCGAATASKMTRHRLSAGLYAPLCVILYEDENGDTVFEYDKPSSLFGQFDDDAVTAVARGLDDALESAIRRAME
jgi:hypothetical protein